MKISKKGVLKYFKKFMKFMKLSKVKISSPISTHRQRGNTPSPSKNAPKYSLDPKTGPQAPTAFFFYYFFFFFLFLGLLLSDLRSAKAFSFHSRSSPNFAYTYM